MNVDQELVSEDSQAGGGNDGDEPRGVADAVSTAVTSVRQQLARVHAGLPPVDEEPAEQRPDRPAHGAADIP